MQMRSRLILGDPLVHSNQDWFDEMDEQDHYASLFMTARLCNLAQVEEYFCYMQKLLIRAGKENDPAYLKHYLRRFPGIFQML